MDGVVCFGGGRVDGEAAAAEGVGELHLANFWGTFLGDVLVGFD